MGTRIVGEVGINVVARSGKVKTGFEETNRAARAMARQLKADVKEANGSLALLGEEFGIHLPRHVRSFIASLPGADVFAELLPAAAVAGLGLAFVEAGKKAYEFVEKSHEAAKELAEGFEAISDKGKLANDELRLTNDRLDEQIAKLTGRRVNTLAAELDEARVAAGKLLESLTADAKATDEVMKKGGVGIWAGLISGQVRTTGDAGIESTIKAQDKALTDLARAYRDKTEAASSAAEKDAIEKERRVALTKLEWQQVKALQDTYDFNNRISQENPGRFNFAAVQEMIQAQIDLRKTQMDHQAEEDHNSDKTDQVKHLQAAKEAAEEFRKSLDADQKAYADAQRESEKVSEELMATWLAGQRAEDAEERQRREQIVQAREDYQKQVQEKVAGIETEVAAARQSYQEFAEMSALRVQLGQESESQRIADLKKMSSAEYQAEADLLNQKLALYNSWTAEYQKVLAERQKLDAEYFKQQMQLAADAAKSGLGSAFDELSRKASDLAGQLKDLVTSSVNALNDDLVKLMTERPDKRRGMWKDTGKQIFTGFAKTGLQDAEGSLLKSLGLGGAGKLGTEANPMWVRMSGAGAAVSQGGALASALGGAGGAAGGSGSGLASFLGAILPLAGFLADGGPVYPGNYLVGERGPEILSIANSRGHVFSNSDSKRMMAGGGGDTHHHWNIDARGAHDPAAVHKQITRAIAEAAPHIAAMSVVAGKEMQRRRPASSAAY